MKTTEQNVFLIETSMGMPIAVCRNYEQAVAALGPLSEERRAERIIDFALRIRPIAELAPWVASAFTDAVTSDVVTSEAS